MLFGPVLMGLVLMINDDGVDDNDDDDASLKFLSVFIIIMILSKFVRSQIHGPGF